MTARLLHFQGNRAVAGGAVAVLNPGTLSCSSCNLTGNIANIGGAVATYLTEVMGGGELGGEWVGSGGKEGT